MIELPSAVMLVDELAEAADFISIGTNDLIQHILAVDRTNPYVSNWYIPYHPAVLRCIKTVMEAGQRHKKDVFICGDMTFDPILLPVLIGMGITRFSTSPHFLPAVRRQIRALNFSQAQTLAATVLGVGKVADVRAILGISSDNAPLIHTDI